MNHHGGEGGSVTLKVFKVSPDLLIFNLRVRRGYPGDGWPTFGCMYLT